MDEEEVQWFGQDWHAKICQFGVHSPTPVSQLCAGCNQPIGENDNGLLIHDLSAAARLPWHLSCFFHNIGCEANKDGSYSPVLADYD